ncbi:discoidin domain-containing protein, partial [Nonomuraea sp. NPDC048882]|uniref:discoidin domain-containing protein n=1 Tax=Nonomuraea sp. NPDC048882 TaxID=3154347 RepID=UPI0033D3CFC9
MRALLAALALLAGVLISPPPAALAAADTNLAAGKNATASTFHDVYRAANVTDGNQATYWESTGNAFPQWIQIDLG